MTRFIDTQPLTHCTVCGKLVYATRKAAKAAARRAHPGERMNAYRCNGWWHYGHLMTAVRRGHAARPRPGNTYPDFNTRRAS